MVARQFDRDTEVSRLWRGTDRRRFGVLCALAGSCQSVLIQLPFRTSAIDCFDWVAIEMVVDVEFEPDRKCDVFARWISIGELSLEYRDRVTDCITETGSDGRRIRNRLDRMCDVFDERGHDGLVESLAEHIEQHRAILDEQIALLEKLIRVNG